MFSYSVGVDEENQKYAMILSFDYEYKAEDFSKISYPHLRFINAFSLTNYRPMKPDGKVLKDFDVDDVTSLDGYTNKTFLKIPSLIDGFIVREIANFAFTYTDINFLYIPGSVETIGYEAFYGSMIERLVLNEGTRILGQLSLAANAISDFVIPSTVSFLQNSFESFTNQDLLLMATMPEVQRTLLIWITNSNGMRLNFSKRSI